LDLLIQFQEHEPGVNPRGWDAEPPGELRRRVALVEQPSVNTRLLPGGMYLFDCAEFIRELAVCLVNINQNLRFGHQISEGRAP